MKNRVLKPLWCALIFGVTSLCVVPVCAYKDTIINRCLHKIPGYTGYLDYTLCKKIITAPSSGCTKEDGEKWAREVMSLIDRGGDPSVEICDLHFFDRFYHGKSLLHCAVEGDLKDLVLFLIDHRVNINAVWTPWIMHKDGDFHPTHRSTPLGLAVQKGSVEMVTLLIKAGANVNAADSQGNTLLHQGAIDLEIAKRLIDAGADVNVQNKAGQTPLMVAFQKRNSQFASFLIQAGGRSGRRL